MNTLLVPAHKVSSNKAAGGESREQVLRSWLQGYYNSEHCDIIRLLARLYPGCLRVIVTLFLRIGVLQSVTSQMKAPTFGGVAYSDQFGTLVDAHSEPIKLRRQCLDVFLCLAATPDAVVEREYIVQTVWGQVAVTDDSLVQCISEIRKALDDSDLRILKTLPRRGYMLVSDAPSSSPSDAAKNTNGPLVLRARAIPRLIGLSYWSCSPWQDFAFSA